MIKSIKIIILMMLVLSVLIMVGCGGGMHNAAAGGDIEGLKGLLEKDPGAVAARDGEGYTPLHRAAQAGHKEAAALLIDRGAPVDERTRDGSGFTALHLAAGENRLETVELLIKKGAKIDSTAKGGRLAPWNALAFAAYNGHKEMVLFLIDKGASLKPAANGKINPLMFAVAGEHKDIVELMLTKGAPVDTAEGKKWEPLHLATLRGNEELVELLLEYGAKASRSDNRDKKTPLHMIIYWKKDHPGVVKLLSANGGDVNALDQYKKTPLHHAAYNGFKESAALLLEKGAPLDAVDDMGDTPLVEAAQKGRKALVRLLLSMHRAAAAGNLAQTTVLLKKYPQMVNSRDREGKTPLHHAAENNRLKIAELLIANGADVNALCKYKHTELLHGVMAKILVPRVGRIKWQKYDKTPLDIAVQKGYSHMAQLLGNHRSTVQNKKVTGK